MPESIEVLQGTLDLLILKALVLGRLHGWGISKRVRQISGDVLDVHQGSLYPALYRLEDKGWIESDVGSTPEGRTVRFYRLTPRGRKAFATEKTAWRLFAAAMDRVLEAT